MEAMKKAGELCFLLLRSQGHVIQEEHSTVLGEVPFQFGEPSVAKLGHNCCMLWSVCNISSTAAATRFVPKEPPILMVVVLVGALCAIACDGRPISEAMLMSLMSTLHAKASIQKFAGQLRCQFAKIWNIPKFPRKERDSVTVASLWHLWSPMATLTTDPANALLLLFWSSWALRWYRARHR